MRYLIAALLLIAPLAAHAQQDERLPDLTPREFEIRGELQVSLPDLQRQPLRGFAPPPRTYVVPADRQPHVSPYAQRLEDLPDDPLAPPGAPSLLRAEPRVGQIDLLAGRYLGRRGRLTINTGGFGLDALYTGFSDFAPSGDDPQLTGTADGFTGRISYTTGQRLRFAMSGDAAYHEYPLFDAYAFVPLMPSPHTRKHSAFGGQVRLEGVGPEAGTLPFEVLARFETSNVDDATLVAVEGSGEFDGPSERRFLLSGKLDTGTALLDGGLSFSRHQLELVGVETGDPSLTGYRAGAAVALPTGAGSLQLGARLLGYVSSLAQEEAQLAVGPIVHFETPLGDAMRFYAINDPTLAERGQAGLFRENPYAVRDGRPLPDVSPIATEIGVEVQSQVVRFKAFGAGGYSPSALYFFRPPPCAACTGARALYTPAYDSMYRFGGGADLTFYAPGNVSVTLGAEYRQARFTGDREDLEFVPNVSQVPFVAPLSARAAVAVPFAGTSGLLQATLHMEGSRPTEVEDESAPGWADLSVEAHYRFAGRFGLLVRADHLAGRAERWPGFPRPPAMITAGLRAGW